MESWRTHKEASEICRSTFTNQVLGLDHSKKIVEFDDKDDVARGDRNALTKSIYSWNQAALAYVGVSLG